MERDALQFNNTFILGTTLWSEIPDHLYQTAASSMNDYNLSYNHSKGETPRKLTPRETTLEFRRSFAWLQEQLQKVESKNLTAIILTHHTPLLKGTSDPKYDGSELTPCFSTDLGQLMQRYAKHIKAWAAGHTHYNFDLTHDASGVRVLSNQRGYKTGSKVGYDPRGQIIET